MCEKRTRKIKKDSNIARLREARRIQRLQRLSSTSTNDDNSNIPPVVDKIAQNRVILELAWKTVALMQKNRLIQQKIIDLQKETSDFVAAVMSHPENQRRYAEHIRLYGSEQKPRLLFYQQMPEQTQIKLEPKESMVLE